MSSLSGKAFVYVLGSWDRCPAVSYVGWTNDVDARIAAHNTGQGAKTTRGRTWRLLYLEKHPDRRAAMRREWHLKRDRKFRRDLLADCGGGAGA
ncbi:MAG: GIY-YIG nuclease family protein [Rhodospirillaceae bacterium]